jgi:hypothetical protein
MEFLVVDVNYFIQEVYFFWGLAMQKNIDGKSHNLMLLRLEFCLSAPAVMW